MSRALRCLAAVSTLSALGTALRLHGGIATLVLVPAAALAFSLVRLTRGDPRPASIAFAGVIFYALTVSGLAAFYALLAAR